MRLIKLGLAGIAVLAAVLARPTAQTTSGEIFGRVSDRDGLGIPGVTVTVFGSGMPAPAIVKTDRSGSYRAPALPAGTYNVWFVMNFFIPVMLERVAIADATRVERNVTLAVRSTAPEQIIPVRISTSMGDIDLALDNSHAPITTTNFLKYVDGGFYTNGRFHRATRPDNYTAAPPDRPMMQIIQGGINPARNSEKFPAIPLERTSVTGLKHLVGTVSMARGAADSATSDFFILLDDQPSLDFGGKRFPDGQGGAAFGRVVAGLEVVRKIQQQPVTNQNLTPPVQIVSIARIGAALDLLADVALHPSFPKDEVERQRTSRLASLVQSRENPGAVANAVLASALFGSGNTYGYTELGVESSLKSVTREDLVAFWTRNFVPNNAALVVAGTITAAELKPLVEKAFGGWQKGAPAPATTGPRDDHGRARAACRQAGRAADDPAYRPGRRRPIVA